MENGKTALVTGGSGGIGGTIAKRLASDGFQVAVQYCGASEAADKVVAEIAAAGGAAFSIRADVSQEVEVAEMFDAVMARGTCDVVVHSAGMMELASSSANALDGFDRTIATKHSRHLPRHVRGSRAHAKERAVHRFVHQRYWRQLSALRRIHRLQTGCRRDWCGFLPMRCAGAVFR